jgi:adenine-specific DNA methylase
LTKEEKIFHSDINIPLLKDYLKYIEDFPSYSKIKPSTTWRPAHFINLRKTNNTLFPYCLFSGYFANHYFGLKQCLEIDSIRYAIECIEDSNKKQWALGVLVSTLSAITSNYGGHFAQPIKIEESNIATVIEKRARSVFHEFSTRISNLSENSQSINKSIDILDGPWKNTLKLLKKKNLQKPTLVYLDAPYTREEYSRYYHVLETLVKYNYPSAVGKGRIPDKKKGERFASEFFSKKSENINNAIKKIISATIENGWFCAWSYSSSGKADIFQIVKYIKDKFDCKVRFFSTPHSYSAQGSKGKQKSVIEYLIIFIPG